jgi:hypothetical protein
VYRHRELPPVDEDPVSEHIVEARSEVVPYRRGDLPGMRRRCEASLEANAVRRIEQELVRLAGSSARVTDERVEARHDEAADTYWLQGTYGFVLYRRPRRSGRAA